MASRKRNGNGRDTRDEQVELLRAIWTEMKALNSRVDKTNERLDAARTELKEELNAVGAELKEELDLLQRRVVESEVRLSTVTTQLSVNVQDLSALIREWREEHRADRADMKARISRLEEHVGLASRQ